MLGQISDWQQEILRAPPQIVVPAAIFVLLMLIRVELALPRRAVPEPDDGLEAEARRWIGERIDEHVEDLEEAYGAIGLEAEEDDLPPGFALRIESFIADMLPRDLDAKGFDLDLRSAIRELAVLHRAAIYEDVVTRTREHLAAA